MAPLRGHLTSVLLDAAGCGEVTAPRDLHVVDACGNGWGHPAGPFGGASVRIAGPIEWHPFLAAPPDAAALPGNTYRR